MMEHAAFTYLFIHANSLAELALESMAAALDADMAAQGDPYADLSDEEREALALAQLGKMDSANLQDGFAWETPEHDAEVRSHLMELEQRGAAEVAPPLGQTPDLGLYLERAYAAREELEQRVKSSHAQVDHATLERLLAALPGQLPPLTQALNGPQFAQWLACYQEGNAPLNTLVGLLL